MAKHLARMMAAPQPWLLASLLIGLLTAGCADYGHEAPGLPLSSGNLAFPAPGQVEPGDAVSGEITRLRAALAREVPRRIPSAERNDSAWIALATAMLASGGRTIDRPRLVVVVDRALTVQEMVVMVARPQPPSPNLPWEVIGGVKVSTGQAGRKHYFLTPTGVFVHGADILDYRALGTFNENHIRGLGLKGMRVWDFGWRTAKKGWSAGGETGDIRLLMHATDPAVLEARLGRPASMGCVRIPAAMNRFLDMHGVLDLDQERAARTDARFRAVLRPDRDPTPLAGNLLIVVDSSGRD